MSEDMTKTTTEVLTEIGEEVPVADFTTIMGLKKDRTRWVNVPEWGSKVKVKALTKAEQVKLRQISRVKGSGAVDETKLEMNLLAMAMVEPKLTFDQVDQLYANSDASALNRISAVALSLSGLTEDYIEAAEKDMKSGQ